MKQLKTLSSIFAKALGLQPKFEPKVPPAPPRPQSDRAAQKMRSQRAFNAMQKMEIQREFETQQKIDESNTVKSGAGAGTAITAEDLETVRPIKPIKTVRFKKPETNA